MKFLRLAVFFSASLSPVFGETLVKHTELVSIFSSAKFHVFRLSPGQDLLLEITDWAKKNKIKAACIVSAVGSLTKVNLRYANEDGTVSQTGFFEIVSLVGTFNESSAHLHASVSNSKGQTFGGHLVSGNLIYTTAEIVVAEINDAVFSREHDSGSGWDELVVRKR